MPGRFLTGAAAALLTFSTLAAAPAEAQRGTAPARAAAVAPAAQVGRWGDNGDCTKYIIFRSDGTFRSYTGGEGRWTLSGFRLTFNGTQVITVRLERIDAMHVRIINPDNSIGTSQRCDGAVAPPPVRAGITAVDLVGRWGDDSDCQKYIVFRSDGTFLSYTGGEGRWSLSGNSLVMSGARTLTMRVERIDNAHLRIFNADGTVGNSQRCPSPAG